MIHQYTLFLNRFFNIYFRLLYKSQRKWSKILPNNIKAHFLQSNQILMAKKLSLPIFFFALNIKFYSFYTG